jgi:hypothetical protein
MSGTWQISVLAVFGNNEIPVDLEIDLQGNLHALAYYGALWYLIFPLGGPV